ncbi:hypothetical protein EFL95_00805 [Nocardioides marmorisolisilvae]|uniref:DUF7660 domain-containing protein n=1 Tax=Nocardioides marmorisolisilvae TaxID=1542737 RepID=A0A3N0DZB9_9ACTN|nr:hypothetical protein [Nocardioides marmorisolisilvae]RNL80958.1 hypothetical protein EFL95_00805 [Nocardioides marmorisolisilvae]
MELVRADLARGADGWEHEGLDGFLEAFGALLGSIENVYVNNGDPLPDSPWVLVAQALEGTPHYE